MKFSNILFIGASVAISKATAACWSEAIGYSCCGNSNTKVEFTDNDGNWGIENGQWCGIVSSGSSDAACWSSALGYPCCSNSNTQVYYKDNDGDWGVENNNWCGIPKSSGGQSGGQTEPDTPQYGSDMKSYAIDYMAKLKVETFCPSNANQKRNGVTYGTVSKKTYPSTTTRGDRKCNVILPPNYSADKKYPVLYLLHGIMGNEDSMLDSSFGAVNISGNLAKDGKVKEMIIVLPNEYAPKDGKSVSAGMSQEYFSGYDNFINDLVNDLMPYIKKNYSILEGRENTAIAGFSMGGRNSLYIGYARPDLFGYVGAFSPAPGVTPGTDFAGSHPGLFSENEFRIKDEKNYTPFVTLISCGTRDSVVGTFPKSYHEILTRNDQPHIWYEIPNADHDGTAVSSGYYNFLNTVFGALNN